MTQQSTDNPNRAAGNRAAEPASEPNAAGATPGPWNYGRTGNEQIMIVGGPSRAYVCHVQIEQRGGGIIAKVIESERHANARLIAACPTMYNYVTKRAAEGDGDAVKILEVIHASRT